MGVLIIIGTAVVIGTVIHRLYGKFTAPSMPVSSSAPPPGNTDWPAGRTVALEAGEHIAGIAAAGRYLAVWVNGPKGDRLLLLDPMTGQLHVALSPP